MPMIRSNAFFVGSLGVLPKHEKKNWYVNTPFFAGSCSSKWLTTKFTKWRGIYCQQRVNTFVKTSSMFWISTSTTTTTTTKMVYQIEVLQQRGSNLISGPYKSTMPGPLLFLGLKKKILEIWWAQPQFLQRGDFPTIFRVYDPSFYTIFMSF